MLLDCDLMPGENEATVFSVSEAAAWQQSAQPLCLMRMMCQCARQGHRMLYNRRPCLLHDCVRHVHNVCDVFLGEKEEGAGARYCSTFYMAAV